MDSYVWTCLFTYLVIWDPIHLSPHSTDGWIIRRWVIRFDLGKSVLVVNCWICSFWKVGYFTEFKGLNLFVLPFVALLLCISPHFHRLLVAFFSCLCFCCCCSEFCAQRTVSVLFLFCFTQIKTSSWNVLSSLSMYIYLSLSTYIYICIYMYVYTRMYI